MIGSENRCRLLKYSHNIHDWFLFLPLIHPNCFLSERLQPTINLVLKSHYIVQLYRDFVLYIHSAYIDMVGFFKDEKRRDLTNSWGEYGKRTYFVTFEGTANQNAYVDRVYNH